VLFRSIGLTGWTGVARLVRGEFLKLRSQDFVTAAEALGLSTSRIIFRHILPNALAPVFVTATFGVAGAILLESSLSFLGFGVPPPTPSWGEILNQSRDYVHFAWWLTLSSLVALLRGRFKPQFYKVINKIAGVILLVGFGVSLLLALLK